MNDSDQLEKGELSLITGLATKAEALARNVRELEATLKVQKEALRAITFGALPEAMDAVGLRRIDLRDDTFVSIESEVRGSLPREPGARNDAFVELERLGGDGLIKTDVLIPFPKKQHNEALALADDLRRQGFAVEVSANVHHMTLGAFVREKLKEGEDFSPETLGITVNRIAKVHLPGGED